MKARFQSDLIIHPMKPIHAIPKANHSHKFHTRLTCSWSRSRRFSPSSWLICPCIFSVASRLRLRHSRADNRFFSNRRSFFSERGSPSLPTRLRGWGGASRFFPAGGEAFFFGRELMLLWFFQQKMGILVAVEEVVGGW